MKWTMPRLISQIRSECSILNCLQANCLVICGSDFAARKQPWDYTVCFLENLGEIFYAFELDWSGNISLVFVYAQLNASLLGAYEIIIINYVNEQIKY